VNRMARPSKPVQLLKLEGKSHRTNKELEYREKVEESLYSGETFKESFAVKSDPIAHKEFIRLTRLYSKIQYIDGLDEQIINRYCMLISQEDNFQKLICKTSEKIIDCDNFEQRLELYKFINNVTTKLNQTRDALLKLEDRLFLNPTSRVRAIPKTPPEEKKKSKMEEFLSRRGGQGGA
jgi:phage terminase small subunit